ncbi:molecular chaperone DnaJ [Bacterioplanes sanyensis]|uniref:Molecular chaperone DnaJ n=1 Tax=Bacterioplanes sanyensis TaxID=1249553 RepID=A0A222FPX9_9GAMM|nr:DNA-J related domain-containing protein [Bacterioplanes sanyensis]ASP40303.1 molecular chaperone DnaJ [Bacterioplanes sanyensis]
MDFDLNASIDMLQQRLQHILADGEARTEHQLISDLQQQGLFNPDVLRDSLTLFRCHFLLMHCLYRIRQQWQAQRCFELDISALRIQARPFSSTAPQGGEALPHTSDPLASYYLDLSQLHTQRDEVEALLQSFWTALANGENRSDDLALLELDNTASDDDVRQQYKRLAMRYHPDRGGDAARFNAISQAYERLKTHFG